MFSLSTERLLIREFELADFASVHRYACDPEVTRYTAWGPNSERETREFLQRCLDAASVSPRRDFDLAIVRRDSGALAGSAGLFSRRRPYREYELGYCLAREAWGCGIASEAARALADFGFDTLRAHRIFACVDPGNARSLAVLERAGFRREGLQVRDTWMSGEWRDSVIYAQLEDERPSPC